MLTSSAAIGGAAPLLPAAAAECPIRIVVANGERARIFRPGRDGGLRESACLVNPERPGEGPASTQVGRARQARARVDEFARSLCLRLAKACGESASARIYLLAEPAFMELLRTHVDVVTHGHIVREIAGDYTGHSAGFIRELLPRRL